MRIGRIAGWTFVIFVGAGLAQADFKYTEKSQVTGGTMVSLANTLGKFSKNAQQINEPQISTTLVKGNRLRREDGKGGVEIIDLDGRRIIHIDDANKSYSVMTFEQMKQAMQRAQERMKEEQAKMSGQKQQPANVKIIPHVEEQETGATRNVLGMPASERKMKVTMEMVSTDPQAQQQQAQSMTWVMTADSWIAPLPGYDELTQFYMRMAKEMDWVPGQMMGGNVMMSQAMQEFKKNQLKLKGMPLLQNTSFTMALPAGAQAQQAQAAQQQQQAQQQKSAAEQAATTMPPTSGKDALTRGIVGGLMGGFGHKKKQQQEQQQQQQQAQGQGTAGQPGNANSGSMMDMTTEVMSFSRAPLDASLFDVPAGYKQVQANPDLEAGAQK
jgi:hypothetical protein